MITFLYAPEINNRIISCELEYLERCSAIIESYKEAFLKYDCEISYSLFWNDGKNFTEQRPSFNKNYQCWFEYMITKNGDYVCTDEVEGYTLGESEGFLYMQKRYKKGLLFVKSYLEVVYVEDTRYLEESLREALSSLEKMFGE